MTVGTIVHPMELPRIKNYRGATRLTAQVIGTVKTEDRVAAEQDAVGVNPLVAVVRSIGGRLQPSVDAPGEPNV